MEVSFSSEYLRDVNLLSDLAKAPNGAMNVSEAVSWLLSSGPEDPQGKQEGSGISSLASTKRNEAIAGVSVGRSGPCILNAASWEPKAPPAESSECRMPMEHGYTIGRNF
jgi:hypothetical protein